jgi:hypothetical protein
MALDDEDLFDSPRPKPSNKIVYQPPGAQWSLDRLPEVESLYQSSFKKRLPLVNKGQGSIHNKWGYDHRNSADVSINPSTPEGQQFIEQLKKANVPFLAFTSAIPGVATGPHVHIGFPSQRTQTKYNVGAQKKTKGLASDDLFDKGDDDLFDQSSEQTQPPTPRIQAGNARPRIGQQSAPKTIEEAASNVMESTNRATEQLKQQAAQTQGMSMGDFRRMENADTQERNAVREQVKQERAARRGPYGSPTGRGMLHVVSNPVTSLTELLHPEEQNVDRETQERLNAADRARSPEVTSIREEYGNMSPLKRTVVAPFARGGSDLLSLAGGVTSLAGLTPNQFSEWANKRAQIIGEASQLTPLQRQQTGIGDSELKEIERGLPEKVATGLADVGVGLAEIILLKKATRLPFNQLLALESFTKSSDQPMDRRIAKATEQYALGSVLDQHLSRPLSAVSFAAPTAAQSTEAVLEGKMSPEDAAIQTGIQGVTGFALGGKQPSSLERGLAREIPRERVEPDAVIGARLRGDLPQVSFRERMAQRGTQTEVQPPVAQERTEVESTPTTPASVNARSSTRDAAVSGEIPLVQRAVSSEPSGTNEPPARFYHRDFGEVIKTEDQSGARAGRTRVQEADDPEKIHYVKTAQLTGRGNERMVPVRSTGKAEPTAESAPVEAPISLKQAPVSAPGNPALPPEQTVPPGPPPPSKTSARKEMMSADRTELDLPELPTAERKAWRTSLEKAKPEDANRLADEVLAKPRALNDEETASLVVRAQQIKNEHAEVMKKIGDAKGDELASKRQQAESLESEFDKLTRATKASGTEKGRTLAAQKLTINQDYDLVSLIQRAKAAKGRDVTPEERARYEKMAGEIETLNKQLTEANEKLAQKDLQKQIDRISRQRQRQEKKETLDDEFAALKLQFAKARAEVKNVQASGLAGIDPEGKLTALIAKMARNRVKAGVTNATQLVDDIHAAISEHIEGITKRDVRDAISGYGLTSQPSQDAAAIRLREIKQLLRDLSAVEDIQGGEPPLRSGLQRDKPSQEIRESQRRVREELRRHPEVEQSLRDPEQQQKTLLDSAKTRLRNRIEDLNNFLTEGRKESKTPSQIVPDNELKQLRQERDRLQGLYDQLPDPNAGQKAIATAVKAAEKSIADIEQRISSGDIIPTRQSVSPWSETLGKLKQRQEDLRKELQNLRATARKGTEDQQRQRQLDNEMARVGKDIAEIQQRISSGDLSTTKEGARSLWTEDLGRAKRERARLQRQMSALRADTPESQQKVLRKKTETVNESIAELQRKIQESDLSVRQQSSGPTSPEIEVARQEQKALRSILSDLRRAAAPKLSEADARARKQLATERAMQTRLSKELSEIERRLSERDFSERPKRNKVIDTPETRALREKLEATKNRFNREMERERPGRWWRNLSGMRKAWLLSGPMTHVRNIVGTVAYQPFDEFSRLPAVVIDAALSKATGQRGIQGPSPVAMLDSVVHAVKQGGAEAKSILRHGATADDLARHQFSEIDTGVKAIDIVHNAIFRFMSASDRVSYQGAYKRNLIDRANVQAKNERESDPSINVRERAREIVEDPPDELRASAEHDAMVNTFNNSNKLSDAIKRGRSALSPQANFAIDLVMPFDRTPTNVIARVLEASPYGYARNAKQLAQSIIKKSMSVEEQRAFSQTFGRATAGTALIALGYALAGKGVLTWEDKRKSINLQVSERKINLSAISPIGSILAVGAGLYRERGSPKGQVKAALAPVAEQPLIRGVSELGSLMTDSDRTLPRVGGRFASSFVPFSGALRTVAQATDSKERKAKTFKENIQQNIPIWRNQLPENVEADRRSRRISFTERLRQGQLSSDEIEAAKQRDEITEADVKRINKESGMTARQADFTNKPPAAALDAYENMTAAQQDHVKDIMARKAYTLLHSDALTDAQKEEYKTRIEQLGISPEAPRRSSSNPFSQRFRSTFK